MMGVIPPGAGAEEKAENGIEDRADQKDQQSGFFVLYESEGDPEDQVEIHDRRDIPDIAVDIDHDRRFDLHPPGLFDRKEHKPHNYGRQHDRKDPFHEIALEEMLL